MFSVKITCICIEIIDHFSTKWNIKLLHFSYMRKFFSTKNAISFFENKHKQIIYIPTQTNL